MDQNVIESHLTVVPGYCNEVRTNFRPRVSQQVDKDIGWIRYVRSAGVIGGTMDGHTLEGRETV